MSGRLVFDDKANKTYMVKRTAIDDWWAEVGLLSGLRMRRVTQKPTRLCCTPDKPKCEECEHGDT